ncbi:hypothetical protein GGI15_004000 [Coemansia interrupta]|uniref:SET domain-containing protein n=1 Tax=Coemansia interrupta TaxID=1126814 RepID=A0A9W8H697_9FUNG|nr:hypothetical protein GGI15_004000 [Coemansia interrupta]
MPKAKTTLAYFPDTFRGMMATKDIEAGDPLVSVPENLLITASKVRKLVESRIAALSNGFSGSRDRRWPLTEHQSLAYWLYSESAKESESRWCSYIRSIPRSFDTIPLCVLAGNAPCNDIGTAGSESSRWLMAHMPHSMKLRVIEQHERLYRDWTATNAFLKEAGLDPLDRWSHYVWAWLAVNTRCIHLGQHAGAAKAESVSTKKHAAPPDDLVESIDRTDSMALAPVLDLLNHSAAADIATRFDPITRQFVIQTNCAFSKGQEAFIRYGPHDNRFMIIEYGFVLARNPYQVLELDHAVSLWTEAAKTRLRTARPSSLMMRPDDVDVMVSTLKQYRMWGDFTISLDDLEPSYRLHAALRLLLLAEQKGMTSKQAVLQWERWRRGEPSTSPGDADIEAAIQSWVCAICQNTAALSRQMLEDIQDCTGQSRSHDAGDHINGFLAHCLSTVWREINDISERCLARIMPDQRVMSCGP